MDESRFQLDRRVNVTGYSLMQCKSKSRVRTVAEKSSNSSKAPHASSTPKGSELANLGEGNCSIELPSWGRTLLTSLIHSYVYYFRNTAQRSPAPVAEHGL